MVIIYQIYILIYKLKYWLKKKIFFKSFQSYHQNELLILEKILNFNSKKNIKINEFINFSEKELPNKIYDKKFLSFIFFNKRNIKQKFPQININNKSEFKKIYFYYKLLILHGWLIQSHSIRKNLAKYRFKKNKLIIDVIKKNKNLYSHPFFKKKTKPIVFNENLFDTIKNKKIAIVGPASNNEKNGREIDCFDVVVRINQLNKENLNQKKGRKTDIIFLNGIKSDEAILKKKIEFLAQTKIIYVKNYSYMNFFRKINFKNIINLCPEIDNIFTLGGANMLPIILFEILKYHPKKIKIFDNDLMLNPKRVKNYQKHSNYRPKDFLNMLTHHDPISQLNFVKFLYKNSKIISGDKNFNSAIKLNEKNYLRKLETNYKLDKI